MRLLMLFERHEIGWTNGLINSLSDDARHAINSWQSVNWRNGDLEQSYRNNGNIAKEIEAVMLPIRNKMKERYGDTVLLYRGIGDYKEPDERVLTSWTASKKEAGFFAGINSRSGQLRYGGKKVSDEEIESAIRKYEKSGFVTFLGYKYKRSNDPYYDIYRGNEYITDGDNIRKEIIDAAKLRNDLIDKYNTSGKILSRNIPIDDIVWITNDLNSKEYIIKNNSV